MSLLVGAACVLALLATGWWPMRAWVGGLVRPGRLGRVSLACAFGAAITGLVQVALSAAGVAAHAAVPIALAAFALLLLRPSVRSATAPAGGGATCPRPSRALRVLLVVVALVSTGAAVGLPFRSDGSKFWAPRARELAEVGASQAPSLHDATQLSVHRNYPLLVPELLAPVFALSPIDAATGPKLVLAALNLALLGVLASQLLRSGARGRMLLVVVATLPFLVGLGVRESAVSSGYVDSADALFLLLVVMGAERLRGGVADGGEPVRLELLVGLLGAALISTKLEGAAELAVVALAWLLTGPVRRPLLRCAAVALLLALPTFIIRAGVAADEPGFQMTRLVDGPALVARGAPVLAGLGGLLLDVSCFGLLPPLLLLWLLTRAAGRARATRSFALWLLLGAAAFLLLSYLATNMQAARHIQTSAHRLAWHWLPALAWLVAQVRAEEPADGVRAGVPAQ